MGGLSKNSIENILKSRDNAYKQVGCAKDTALEGAGDIGKNAYPWRWPKLIGEYFEWKDMCDPGDDLPSGGVFTDPIEIDPLVIDLDGDGVELTSLRDSKAMFDLNNDGFAEHTGWVSKDDGLLVMDRNGNGRIDNGTELFGDQSGDANGCMPWTSKKHHFKVNHAPFSPHIETPLLRRPITQLALPQA